MVWLKMVIKKDPELTTSHRHTECIEAYRTISSEKSPKTSSGTPIHQTNEKKPTLKQVGEHKT